MREVRRRSLSVDEGFSVFAPLLVPLESGLCGSSLGIEFVLNQDHGQFGALCLNQRGDRIQNLAAIACLCDSPASTLPLVVKRRVRFATLFIHIVRCTALAPASTTLREFELGKVWTTWVSTHKDHSLRKDTRADNPHEQHKNHAHGKDVKDQRNHEANALFLGLVVRIQLADLFLSAFDPKQRAEQGGTS